MTHKLLVSLGGCVFALTPTFSGDLKMLATSMLLRRTAPRVAPVAARSFAMGPAAGGTISDELLDKLGGLSTQALIDGLWVMGWPAAQLDDVKPLSPTMKLCGRAVTLNFVPVRPDISVDKPPGGESPEYEAFELCGPKEVLHTRARANREREQRPPARLPVSSSRLPAPQSASHVAGA